MIERSVRWSHPRVSGTPSTKTAICRSVAPRRLGCASPREFSRTSTSGISRNASSRVGIGTEPRESRRISTAPTPPVAVSVRGAKTRISASRKLSAKLWSVSERTESRTWAFVARGHMPKITTVTPRKNRMASLPRLVIERGIVLIPGIRSPTRSRATVPSG